jgi:hypothetical protein
LFFLGEGTLHADEVLVQLVLGQDVAPHSLVQAFNLVCLELHVLVFSLVELEALLKLKLKESVLLSGSSCHTEAAVLVSD